MIRYFVLILLTSQLLACASINKATKAQNHLLAARDVENISAVQQWHMLGRLSVRNANKSWLTLLEWKHDALVDNLTLSTSLGGVVAKLGYSKHGMVMVDEKGVLQRVSEEQLKAMLGYTPPLEHLAYWVRGLPSPKKKVEMDKDQSMGVMRFKQEAWTIQLERFSEQGGLLLPGKITLLKDTLKIKLVIDEWLT